MPSLPVSRQRALVLAAVALALLAVAGRTLAGAGTATMQPAATLVPEQTAAPRLVVHVAGAVRRPGLYRLAEGKRVADAVARAGGATAKADTAAINLAAPLADGIQVLVPSRVVVAAGSPAAGSSASGSAAAGPVSLSSATVEQLDALPGVGPVTAQKILDYRAEHGGFRSVDDLDAIPGIGPARLEQLRDVVMP
jgi:competence protein ComEA